MINAAANIFLHAATVSPLKWVYFNLEVRYTCNYSLHKIMCCTTMRYTRTVIVRESRNPLYPLWELDICDDYVFWHLRHLRHLRRYPVPGPRFTIFFSTQFKLSMEITFHSHFHSNIVIATKFCTWHDSWAVVSCAKIGCDPMTSNGITARRSFHRI